MYMNINIVQTLFTVVSMCKKLTKLNCAIILDGTYYLAFLSCKCINFRTGFKTAKFYSLHTPFYLQRVEQCRENFVQNVVCDLYTVMKLLVEQIIYLFIENFVHKLRQ